MTPLHIEVYGKGPPLVMLHGWGMHGGVFKPWGQHLARKYSVVAVDLPGHGDSASYSGFADLEQHTNYIPQALDAVLREGVVLAGWSLGGLLALQLAIRYPRYIKQLVLVSATPCFCMRADWRAGVAPEVLAQFTQELQENYRLTLSRFLALQFMGSREQKENLRRARELVFAKPAPRHDMLQQGLHLLEKTDLREQVQAVCCPTIVLNGERDSLVPSAAAQYLAEHLANGRCVILKGAGHAPFLSHTTLTNKFLDRFLHEH